MSVSRAGPPEPQCRPSWSYFRRACRRRWPKRPLTHSAIRRARPALRRWPGTGGTGISRSAARRSRPWHGRAVRSPSRRFAPASRTSTPAFAAWLRPASVRSKRRRPLSILFVALDHKVPESARSIGLLCTGDECDKLAAKLGSQPFAVVTSGLEPALLRFSDDLPDDLKVKIVARVRELGTGEANRFLRDVQAKWPKRGSLRLKQAIDQAVLATSGSPGAGGQNSEGTAP